MQMLLSFFQDIISGHDDIALDSFAEFWEQCDITKTKCYGAS